LRSATLKTLWAVCLTTGIAGFAQAAAPATPLPAKRAGSKTKKSPDQNPKIVGAAGLIAIAQHQLEKGDLAGAAQNGLAAASRTSLLEDYGQYIRAQAEYQLRNYAEVDKSATRVFNHVPTSPFVGAAAALAIRADLDGDRPKQGLELIKKYYDLIPQPQADLLLARSFASTGDLPQAAEYYQRVYYNYPTAPEATDAANALVDLKTRLGDAFPPAMPAALIGRAQKLFEANNPGGARIELEAAIPQLGGAQRDLARVRLGVADLLANKPQVASDYLNALKVDDPEADAERLSYLIRCARKSDRHADVKTFLDQLQEQHPTSPWRLDALIYVADQARTENDSGTYLPLYRACAATFPKEPRAAWCHWRIALESYRKDGPDAYDLLRAHVQQYPKSEDINNSLYFLGRLVERKNENASARACYEELIRRFPNTYYAVVARERLKQPSLQAVTANPEMVAFLEAIPWPPRPEFPSFTPSELAQRRISRANLLQLSGLNDFAEGELKFGAHSDGAQGNVYAMQLARFATARKAPDQALRYIKVYASGYLYMPLDQAPIEFWKFAFPIPYRASIQKHSLEQSLDPSLVAALIRQESEFNVTAKSPANAYGLMQLLPTTGSQLARHFGIRRLRSAQLLTADRNIQLGTYFFHNLLNSYGGQTEIALASYNAGPSRANLWESWGPFREPAEFIETVPFHETRNYIQIVLRNADIYKRLYASAVPDIPSYRPKPAPRVKPRKQPIHRHTDTRYT
jgi:soluble lytic murein transglycosylase